MEKPQVKEPATMKVIAEEAGVTLTTVSRILNNKGDKYAEKTKERIFEIADRLKYRPNALVRGMQTGTTRMAGVMLPADFWFYGQIIGGIHEVFLENDTIMLLAWSSRALPRRDVQQERRIIHQLVDRRVDAVILRPSSELFERSYFEEIWEREIPLILVDRELSNITTDFVGTDDVAGGQAAAEYLLELGHRRMLFIGDSGVSTSRYREKGFRYALGESLNTICTAMDKRDVEPSVWGEDVAQTLRGEERPTAIFCYSDYEAEIVLEAAQKAGLSVPGDISVVGFGNLPHGRDVTPITTFDQSPHTIGKTAAEMYLDRVYNKKKNSFRRELIKPKLMLGSSSGPSPSGGS